MTDIYTIVADRLISKDLSTQSATVTIVEGSAVSQTIVVFRNSAQISTSTSDMASGNYIYTLFSEFFSKFAVLANSG